MATAPVGSLTASAHRCVAEMAPGGKPRRNCPARTQVQSEECADGNCPVRALSAQGDLADVPLDIAWAHGYLMSHRLPLRWLILCTRRGPSLR